MENKRGDIPITILVIGVFAVCSLALLSFFYSDIKVKNSFVGIDLMEKMNLQIEKYSMGDLENLDTKVDKEGNVFLYQEKNTTGGGIIFWKKEKTMFSVKYNLP